MHTLHSTANNLDYYLLSLSRNSQVRIRFLVTANVGFLVHFQAPLPPRRMHLHPWAPIQLFERRPGIYIVKNPSLAPQYH